MKISELIKITQESMDKYGDMDVEIRDKDNGNSYFEILAYPDALSSMEIEEHICGTFTIEFYYED